jgi:hypothetical protein
MKAYFLLMLFFFGEKPAISQTLEQLNRLRILPSIDEADNIIRQWGFTFDKSEIVKKDTATVNLFYFKKESSNIDSSAALLLSKEQSNGFRLFDVGFYTYSSDVFNELKRQCQIEKKCILKKETNEPNGTYVRYFSDGITVYEFMISPPSKTGDINLYIVLIKI